MTVRPITHSMTAVPNMERDRTVTPRTTQYDATEVMQGVTEVLCYGTAIVADRVQP